MATQEANVAGSEVTEQNVGSTAVQVFVPTGGVVRKGAGGRVLSTTYAFNGTASLKALKDTIKAMHPELKSRQVEAKALACVKWESVQRELMHNASSTYLRSLGYVPDTLAISAKTATCKWVKASDSEAEVVKNKENEVLASALRVLAGQMGIDVETLLGNLKAGATPATPAAPVLEVTSTTVETATV